VLQHFSEHEKIFVATRSATVISQEATKAVKEKFETAENGFIELSDEELHALVDLNARELLGISGEEFLQRLREKNPLRDDLGRPVPAWGPVAMLADLLND
jgi:hypothetical protein